MNRTLFFGFSALLEIDYRYLSGVGGDRLLNKNKRDITVDTADFEKQLELLCN